MMPAIGWHVRTFSSREPVRIVFLQNGTASFSQKVWMFWMPKDDRSSAQCIGVWPKQPLGCGLLSQVRTVELCDSKVAAVLWGFTALLVLAALLCCTTVGQDSLVSHILKIHCRGCTTNFWLLVQDSKWVSSELSIDIGS